MPSCIAPLCPSGRGKKKGEAKQPKIHLFTFPDDKFIRCRWIRQLRKDPKRWQPGISTAGFRIKNLVRQKNLRASVKINEITENPWDSHPNAQRVCKKKIGRNVKRRRRQGCCKLQCETSQLWPLRETETPPGLLQCEESSWRERRQTHAGQTPKT